MFYDFFNRIRTVGGMGAWHGRRNHPAHGEGIAISLWGYAKDPEQAGSPKASDNVTLITAAGGQSHG